MTLVRFEDDQEQSWFRVNKEDIVKSFINDSLKIVSSEMIEKYDIKGGDTKGAFNFGEDFEDDLNNCEYADTYLGDCVIAANLDNENIYFDSYNDEFFDNTEGWETDDFYYYHDGSNWQMKLIIEIKEVEAEHLGNENYDTGCYETYALENGEQYIINSSMYQGSIDYVEKNEEAISNYNK